MPNRVILTLTVALLVVVGTAAEAAIDAGDLCTEKKVKAAGLKAFMLLKAFGKNIKKPNIDQFLPAVSKARSKFERGFATAEVPGGCAVEGDAIDVEPAVDACVEDLLSLIAQPVTTTTTPGSTTTTTTLPPVCGDSNITGYEQCEPSDLGGATCGDLGFNLDGALGCTGECLYDVSGCVCEALPATGQTSCWNTAGAIVACSGTGHDGDTLRGSPLAYVNNGNGTITDLNSGLMWEVKSDNGTITDWDTTYTWDQTFTVHVAGLNSTSFAGYTDWRVPNAKELGSIMNYEVFNPAVHPVFNTGCTPGCTVATCSCTKNDYHWSSTTAASILTWVWAGNFGPGGLSGRAKTPTPYYVRAVRGGP